MAKRENYNDLYLFMLVVREGSFTAAAQRLGWRNPALAVPFVNWKSGWACSFWCVPPRKLSLTQAGEQLYQTVESGFDALDSGLSTLAYYRHTPSGTVRINASQHAIDKVLLPKLAVFKQRYPDIRLELIGESRFVDIIAERFDAGCVWGRKSAAAWWRCAFRQIWRWLLSARPSIFAATAFRKRPQI